MKNNPYIGPRPYERQDRDNFYGRAREARDLLALILAERVVLFYAQSGAGKTSLLNTQIIPALEEEGFDVLPAARVGSDLPPGVDPKSVKNIFVFSALMGLAGPDVPPSELSGHTLLSFLQSRQPVGEGFAPTQERASATHSLRSGRVAGIVPTSTDTLVEDKPPILILDQFEEILTTHRERWQEARGFFEQMQAALREIIKVLEAPELPGTTARALSHGAIGLRRRVGRGEQTRTESRTFLRARCRRAAGRRSAPHSGLHTQFPIPNSQFRIRRPRPIRRAGAAAGRVQPPVGELA